MTKSLLAQTLASAALLCACVDEPNLSSTGGISYEEFKARMYREPSTGLYVIDWDTVVSGDAALREVWAATQQGALAVMTENGVDVKWSPTQVHALTYCISNTFGTRKQLVIDALRTASDNGWEKMADVNFTYVAGEDANCTASNTNVMFDVNPVNANGEYVARSFFPNSPRSERNVLIDGSAFTLPAGGPPLANVLAHELGHTIGFRHEHIRPEANATQCAEDNNFRGLTPYDSASVMHYPQCNGTSKDLAFTTRDRDGVVALYGAPVPNMSPMAQILTPANGARVPPSFSVEANIMDGDLMRADLYVDGTMTFTVSAGPFVFQVQNLAAGAHTLDIKATDSANQTTTTTVSVTVAASGTGSGSGTGTGTGEDPNNDGPDGYGDDVVGGCAAGGSGSGSLAFVTLAGLVGVRRRRRRPTA